jgi:fibronectin type 3 domain-containing protein
LSAALVSGAVRLNWSDNSTDETGFIVQRSVNGGAYTALTTVGAGVATLTDSSAPAGSTCTYRVCSVNAVGASAPSGAVSVALPAPPPAAASGLTAVATSTSVTLAWTDNATNESSYRVERSANGGSFLLWIVLPSNSTRYVDTSVAAGATYAYRIVASNSSGNAAASNVASVVIPGTTPLAPTSLGGIAASRTQINLSWIDNATNETGFLVERSTNGSTWTQVGSVGANLRTYNATGLKSNTIYYFRVRAFNGFGNSAYTSTIGVRTLR